MSSAAAASTVEGLRHEGFAVTSHHAMREMLPTFAGRAWESFATSWDRLELDTYLLERGIHRKRRHAVFSVSLGGNIARGPHQPHYQSREYNGLQGGIERWFAPIEEEVGESDVLQAILSLCASVVNVAAGRSAWRVEVHQFRIEAAADLRGQPTPEGVHRDGVDFVLVLLVTRENVESGTTSIHSPDGSLLGSFTLRNPLDGVFVDDARVFHGVTPIHASDRTIPGHRDVLVVTFKREVAP